MRDPLEKYVEDVLCYADLARDDERNVGAELAEHLHSMVQASGKSDPKEIDAMLKDQFGNPKKVGRGIAIAKGRLRTYFKKARRRLPIQCAVALLLGLAVRCAVAQSFYVAGDGVAPVIPRGSRVLVYKLAHSFQPGDIVVFRNSDGIFLAGTIQCRSDSGGWSIERNSGSAKKEVHDVPPDRIVGRVFLNTR
jgi:hypothetical protein